MDNVFDEVKEHFAEIDEVTVNEGRGAQGIKLGKKMVVMFYKGSLLLKLPPQRVTELIESGHGEPYDPGTGSAMKDRIIVPSANSSEWIALSTEALQWAKSSST